MEENKTPEIENTENQITDEELYTKIQTEKLIKSRKVKKISIISCLAVVFAIAVVIICLAAIPVDLKPNFLQGTDYSVRVFINGDAELGELSADGEYVDNYNEFQKVFNDAFRQAYFSSMFNGSLFNYEITERTPYSEFQNMLNANDDYIQFNFAEDQILKNKDGSIYSSTRYTAYDSFTFNEAYLLLSNEEGNSQADFYVLVEYNSNTTTDDGEESEQRDYRYFIKVTTTGDTYSIFDFYNPNSENA